MLNVIAILKALEKCYPVINIYNTLSLSLLCRFSLYPQKYWYLRLLFFTDLGDDDQNATYWSYVQEVIDSLEPSLPELIPEGKI